VRYIITIYLTAFAYIGNFGFINNEVKLMAKKSQQISRTGKCKDCSDKSCAVSILKNQELDVLAQNSSELEIPKGEIVIREGELTTYVAYLKSGLVKEHLKGLNGKNQIIKLIKSKSYLGLSAGLSSKVSLYTYSALEDLNVCFIDLNILKQLMKDNGHFAYEILLSVSRENITNSFWFVNKNQKQIYGRCADAMLYFSKVIFEKNKFTLPISHCELAALIGTTRESVTRTLSKFKSDGILQIKDRLITIVNNELLENISKNG
jgi:CRP/FNR family transcriptional regulator